MFAAPGSVMQYASTLYMSITFMGLHIAYLPFESTRENVLQVTLTANPDPDPTREPLTGFLPYL